MVAIGHVEEDRIHSGIHKHLGVLTDHPVVVGDIVAKVRLTPMVHHSYSAKGRIRWIGVQKFLDVVGALGVARGRRHDLIVVGPTVIAMTPMPKEVERGHIPVSPVRHIRIGSDIRINGIPFAIHSYP